MPKDSFIKRKQEQIDSLLDNHFAVQENFFFGSNATSGEKSIDETLKMLNQTLEKQEREQSEFFRDICLSEDQPKFDKTWAELEEKEKQEKKEMIERQDREHALAKTDKDRRRENEIAHKMCGSKSHKHYEWSKYS